MFYRNVLLAYLFLHFLRFLVWGWFFVCMDAEKTDSTAPKAELGTFVTSVRRMVTR